MAIGFTGKAALVAAATLLAGAAWADDDEHVAAPFYSIHALVSDGSVPADHTDPGLVNPWGIVFNPTAVVWIANNGSNTSTLYDGTGAKIPLTVAIPPGANGPAGPTGIVFNPTGGSPTGDFQVTANGVTGPAVFLFAAENGTITGWAPTVDKNNAILAFDTKQGAAVYKGLALAANGQAEHLYATDFHNAKVDVFDTKFAPVSLSGGFKDPNIPAGYAPFGIANIQGDLYVTYAKQDAERHDDVKGVGFGFVDVFDSNGNLLRRLASGGRLNAPWGIALAPADFGRFSHYLLIGNFGDGTIDAFDPITGHRAGRLHTPDGHILKIDGLWGLRFGNGLLSQPTSRLFFTAGPQEEQHGLYGRLDPVPGVPGNDGDDDDE
jgi:uncharacterized protein (TIGR03118 family)